MSKQRQSPHGFTLIELLIVVAIIAILAAIAVPNFLEAQTRAKVSRVRSDLRTIATAMETYVVDHNVLPPRTHEPALGRWGLGTYTIWRKLTTPIAYVTGSVFDDPFADHLPADSFRVYIYLVNNNHNVSTVWSAQIPPRFPTIKRYAAHSHGPNRVNDANNLQLLIYDPTNGTVSDGNIWLVDGNNEPDGSYQWPDGI